MPGRRSARTDRRLPAPDAARRPEAARRAVRAARRRRRAAAAAAARRRETIAPDDRHRRLRQGRPAHRQHRRLRGGRRLDQAAAADARRRRGGSRAPCSPASSRPTARAAGRQAHRDGRQPRAAQDEVRRQRRHGAGRLARRREGAARPVTCSSRTPARCRACASAEGLGAPWPKTTSSATYPGRGRWGDDGADARRRGRSSRTARCSTFPHLPFDARGRVGAALPRPALGRRARRRTSRCAGRSGELRGAAGAADDLADAARA